MPKSKLLSDLFVVGKTVTISDGQNEEEVFVQKINQFEHDQSVREANKRKALVLAKLRLAQDSADRAEYNVRLGTEVTASGIIDILVMQDVETMRQAKEDEVAAEDKWAEEGFLQGILDAWKELEEDYLVNREDASEEARNAYAAMEEYNEEVEAQMEAERRRQRKDYQGMSNEELTKELTDRLIALDADTQWIDTYTKQRLVFAIRDPQDHKTRLIDDLQDLNMLQPQAIAALKDAYAEVVMDGIEGKD